MVHFRIARFLSHRLALLGDLRGSHPTRSAIRTKTLCSRLIVEFIALELRRLESRLHHQLRIPLVHDRQAKMLGMHVAQDPSSQALSAVCEGVHRESRPRPRRSLRGRIRQVPIVPASEGARNISVRGSQEYLQTRELRTNQQSKSKETKKNHQVITVAKTTSSLSAQARRRARHQSSDL